MDRLRRISNLIRNGNRLLPPAVVLERGRGYVLVGGEHRFAAMAQIHALGQTVKVFILRTWDEMVAWMMADLDSDKRYSGTPWTVVDAAYFQNKAMRLLPFTKSDQPGYDVAEYTGHHRGAIDNVRYAIAVAADPSESDHMRNFARAELVNVLEQGHTGHSIRDRIGKERKRIAAPKPDAKKQLDKIEQALAQLRGVVGAISDIAEIAEDFDKERAVELAADLGRMNTRLSQLKIKLRERANS